MLIGLNGGGHARSLAAIRTQAREAARDGFASYWLSQISGPDALTALAVIGSETPGIALGVSIVPIFGRHPIALAIQALTAQAASGGRLVLGIGVSHQVAVEGAMGLSYARSFTYAREYVAALRPLLRGDAVSVAGEQVTARAQLAIDDAIPPPVILAALGARMLDLAGREADGCTTWMVGPKTLRDHIIPSVTRAAEAAKRSRPRVVVGLPVCVTGDRDAARAFARQQLGVYGTLPAYRALLDREGVGGPEDLVIAGNEDEVGSRIIALSAGGATDFRATELCPSPDDAARTRALLKQLAHAQGAS
jgi:F420-dependent oxidoreductase-like protein